MDAISARLGPCYDDKGEQIGFAPVPKSKCCGPESIGGLGGAAHGKTQKDCIASATQHSEAQTERTEKVGEDEDLTPPEDPLGVWSSSKGKVRDDGTETETEPKTELEPDLTETETEPKTELEPQQPTLAPEEKKKAKKDWKKFRKFAWEHLFGHEENKEGLFHTDKEHAFGDSEITLDGAGAAPVADGPWGLADSPMNKFKVHKITNHKAYCWRYAASQAIGVPFSVFNIMLTRLHNAELKWQPTKPPVFSVMKKEGKTKSDFHGSSQIDSRTGLLEKPVEAMDLVNHLTDGGVGGNVAFVIANLKNWIANGGLGDETTLHPIPKFDHELRKRIRCLNNEDSKNTHKFRLEGKIQLKTNYFKGSEVDSWGNAQDAAKKFKQKVDEAFEGDSHEIEGRRVVMSSKRYGGKNGHVWVWLMHKGDLMYADGNGLGADGMMYPWDEALSEHLFTTLEQDNWAYATYDQNLNKEGCQPAASLVDEDF
jgi:hypothetical protein